MSTCMISWLDTPYYVCANVPAIREAVAPDTVLPFRSGGIVAGKRGEGDRSVVLSAPKVSHALSAQTSAHCNFLQRFSVLRYHQVCSIPIKGMPVSMATTFYWSSCWSIQAFWAEAFLPRNSKLQTLIIKWSNWGLQVHVQTEGLLHCLTIASMDAGKISWGCPPHVHSRMPSAEHWTHWCCSCIFSSEICTFLLACWNVTFKSFLFKDLTSLTMSLPCNWEGAIGKWLHVLAPLFNNSQKESCLCQVSLHVYPE